MTRVESELGATKRSARFAVSVTLLFLVWGLAACAPDEADSDSPYAAEFEQARNQATTDFQREVLADDTITDAEFREVQQRYVDCLADAGIQAVAHENGSFDVSADLSGNNSAADVERKCSRDTHMPISGLYLAMHINPNNEDFSKLIVECLHKQGVVEENFTKDDWDDFVWAFAKVAGDGTGPTPDPVDFPKLPGGALMSDPPVQKCADNPLGLPNPQGL
ncbi:hypothetical protein [Georgenia yuyongxinii]|uniref:Uncharacterized protein n=1 Tax=Georgenia yuyongxinii TaxID=2589797 RepID=A0A552WP69_9MICO|nr:hypothetical protein [Georgenia yuyongxinii]TRW44399.1 hypothetical protein FJ693_13800 [Georgenia yuyongxinii]